MRSAFLALPFMLLFALALSGVANALNCQTLTAPNFNIIGVTWGNATNPALAGPGSRDVPLVVTLQSFGNACDLYQVVGTINLYGQISNFNGSYTAKDYIQELPPTSIFTMTFYLNIANNTAVGQNAILKYPFYISWNYTNSTTRNTQSYVLQIPMKGYPVLNFTLADPSLVVGEINNITLKLSNTGNSYASNISTKVSSSSSISFISQPGKISLLNPGESNTISFYGYISPSLSGQPVILTVTSHYINPYGYNTTVINDVGAYASPNPSTTISISASNASLLVGKLQNLNITVSNYGKYTVDNITLLLNPVSPLSVIGNDNLLFIPKLAPGESDDIPIILYVQSTTSPVADLEITLSYIQNNQAQTSSRSISFLTPGYINLTSISSILIPNPPHAGQIFSVTATLDNVGSQSALAATVTSSPPDGMTIVGENSTFIGSIPVYTPTAFTISFLPSKTMNPGVYSIPVTVSYLNNLNQRLNSSFVFDVNISAPEVASPGSNSGGTETILLLFFVAMVAIASAYYYLHSKRTRMHT